MIASSSKKGSGSKPSTNLSADSEGTVSPTSPKSVASSLPGRIRASSSCPYLPILGGLSGPASPAEVTKEIAFGGVVDNSGKFSPRIVESEGGYFAIRNTSGGIGEREGQPASPRRATSSASLVTSGTSAVISRECGWGEMIAGIETEGGTGGTVHQYFYHHRRTNSGNYESPEELLLRVKTKSSSSNLSFQQIHHQPTAPIQRSSSSLSLSFTPTGASAVATHTTITSSRLSTPTTPGPSSANISTSTATSSVSKTNAKPSPPLSNPKTSPKSSLRLRLPPPPKVHIDALGIGVHPLLLPYHPHHRLFPNTPDGRTCERRRDSAPGLLLPGIHPRAGDWLLTPPDEEVGGMVWHMPTPSDVVLDNMADSQEIVEGEDAEDAKTTDRRAATEEGLPLQDDMMRKEDHPGSEDMVSEKENGEDEGAATVVEDDVGWGLGEEWLRGAADVLLSTLSPSQFRSEAVRILSYTLPCPLPSSPDPALLAVGASITSNHQDRLPESAASAPEVAAIAGQQLSPAITARLNSKRPNASTIPIGCRDGVTTTIHTITSAIQRRHGKDEKNRVYINVSHAIPPHIPLNRLPSIPPIAGPLPSGNGFGGFFESPFAGGVSSEGGGYFSPTIFNSIVVAPSNTPGPRPQLLPGLCNPILPPNSLHFSILERFIPPSSVADDTNMFSPTSSILLDRLVELNENNGSLLFIYPTKTGAREFVKNILGPVLDPLLRKLMVIHRLRDDLLWRIRNMSAVEGMADWDELKLRMEKLCKTLSNGGLPVKVVYASTAKLRLNDDSWREWWSQQEQTRIKDIMQSRNTGPASTGASQPSQQQAPTVPSGINYTSEKSPAMTLPVHSIKPKQPQGTVASDSAPPKKQNSPPVPPKRETPPGREAPPRSIDLSAPQLLSPRIYAPLSPLSPEASAHYLGIRHPNLSPHLPTTGPLSTTHPSMSTTPGSHSSGSFTTGYGFPGDLAREVLDGVRAPAVRPSSKGMGEAVMASALAGSSGNSLVGQAMGGVVGEGCGRKEGSIHRGNSGNGGVNTDSGNASGSGSNPWAVKRKSEESIEVGIFVLRRTRT